VKELLSSAFNEYLGTQGTVLKDIPDYIPELNGTMERNIRNVMNVIAACYIKNRFKSSSKSTPHELWYGTKPHVSGL
jgi:hypothetical protein